MFQKYWYCRVGANLEQLNIKFVNMARAIMKIMSCLAVIYIVWGQVSYLTTPHTGFSVCNNVAENLYCMRSGLLPDLCYLITLHTGFSVCNNVADNLYCMRSGLLPDLSYLITPHKGFSVCNNVADNFILITDIYIYKPQLLTLQLLFNLKVNILFGRSDAERKCNNILVIFIYSNNNNIQFNPK